VVEFTALVPGNYTLIDHAIFRVDKGCVGFLKVSLEQPWRVFLSSLVHHCSVWLLWWAHGHLQGGQGLRGFPQGEGTTFVAHLLWHNCRQGALLGLRWGLKVSA
jgi:hypothetical protein